jgi:hypothetical protein
LDCAGAAARPQADRSGCLSIFYVRKSDGAHFCAVVLRPANNRQRPDIRS